MLCIMHSRGSTKYDIMGLIACYLCNRMEHLLFRVIFQMKALQLDKLFEAESTQGNALSRILPAGPREILRMMMTLANCEERGVRTSKLRIYKERRK